jgi:hypothetical protein
MNAIPVKYVGGRPIKRCDHLLPGNSLTWTPGQIHFVPADAAVALTKYADQWRVANETDLSDPSMIGFVIDADNTPVETEVQRLEREEHEQAVMATLPNLEPLSKDSIAQFAKREFGVDLDTATMKKVEMLKSIRDIAAGRMATGKLEQPGRVTIALEVNEPEAVRLVASGAVEMGMRIEGRVDPANLPQVPSFAAIKPDELPAEPPKAE